jgi:hypothetical protein
MRLEIGDPPPDFFALGLHPIQRWRPVRFDDGPCYQCFDTNALCERHGVFDEKIEIGLPIKHENPPLASRRDKALRSTAFGALVDVMHEARLVRFRFRAGKTHLETALHTIWLDVETL